MFILGDQRDDDVVGAFSRYEAYLKENQTGFPESAYSLATSDWYFGFSDHRAPHDAWLESVEIFEPSQGERQETRAVSISIRLLGTYHDGFIELNYPKVFEYRLATGTLGRGHGDWRYDEFRLKEEGQLVHEIEWASYKGSHSWLIVASDVEHKWIAKE